MFRAVAFDLDGTFIDSTEAIVDSFNHTFGVLGRPQPDRAAIVDSIGHILEDQFATMIDHDPAECVRIYREHYKVIACDKTFLLPGARETIERFRDAGVRVGFATSKQREYAEMILEHLGVLDFFEVRLGPGEVSHPKPHPEVVLTCLDHFGVGADEMLFVGDTHFDVLAAQAAHVPCVCVTTGYATREALEALKPSAVFDTLQDVGDYALGQVSPTA